MKEEELREIFRELAGEWSDFWFTVRLVIAIAVSTMCIFVVIVALGMWL